MLRLPPPPEKSFFSYQPSKHRSHTKHTNHSLFPLEAAARFSATLQNTKDSPSADLREPGKITLLAWMKDGDHDALTCDQRLMDSRHRQHFNLRMMEAVSLSTSKCLDSGDKDQCRGLGGMRASPWLGTLACIPSPQTESMLKQMTTLPKCWSTIS